MYVQLIWFLHTGMTQVVDILPHIDKNLPVLDNQYHGCWCPGDTSSQAISTHDINYVEPE